MRLYKKGPKVRAAARAAALLSNAYNPSQPRVPVGSRRGGQWTITFGSPGSSMQVEHDRGFIAGDRFFTKLKADEGVDAVGLRMAMDYRLRFGSYSDKVAALKEYGLDEKIIGDRKKWTDLTAKNDAVWYKVQAFAGGHHRDVVDGLNEWQTSTWGDPKPIAMKILVSRHEGVPMTWKKSKDPRVMEGLMRDRRQAEILADDPAFVSQFYKARGVNQAYMDHIGVKEVTLYRGVGGNTGAAIRATGKRHVDVREASMSGYTDHIRTARNFGGDVGGVTLVVKFKAKDVLFHKDMISGVTGELGGEHEFIVRGGPRRARRIDKTLAVNKTMKRGPRFDLSADEGNEDWIRTARMGQKEAKARFESPMSPDEEGV